MSTLDRHVAEAILAVDTLWGGDVMCPSGTGRFIADSWFSDEPLPAAYAAPSAARVRTAGGVGAKSVDRESIRAYLSEVNVAAAIDGVKRHAASFYGLRREYVLTLALCFEVMWALAREIFGDGPPVPYERCVIASTGRPPEPSQPARKRERVAELLDATPAD